MDAPLVFEGHADWLLRHTGTAFTGIYFAGTEHDEQAIAAALALANEAIPVRLLVVAAAGQAQAGMFEDSTGLAAARYDAAPGSFYLLRPDQHVCARWRSFDAHAVRAAVARACGHQGLATNATPTRDQMELA